MKKYTITNSGNTSAPYEIRFDEDGKKKKKRFKNRVDAVKFLDALNADKFLPDDLNFRTDERIVFANIKSFCESNKIDLKTIYDYIVINADSLKPIKKIEWKTALDLYLKTFASQISITTENFYRKQIKSFCETNKITYVSEFLKNTEFLLNNCNSPAHVKRALNPFSKWLVRNGYLPSNPFTNVKPRAKLGVKELPSVLTIQETELLFKELPDNWRPAFALWAFVGLRPSELIDQNRLAMTIGDIDFENKKITVRGEISKMKRQPRIIVNAPMNLWAWLEPLKLRPSDSQIVPNSYSAYQRLKSKLTIELPKDVLRHSFGTYAFFEYGESIAKDIMGHAQGTNTLFKHYKGLATADDAKKYFKIVPKI